MLFTGREVRIGRYLPEVMKISIKTFKIYLRNHYSMLVCSVFDVNLLCTWSISRECPCHRS